MTYESDIVEAMQWVYDNKDTYNIRVVNLSMNSTVAQSYHTSPLCATVEILWFNSIVVVVSAGNNGTGGGPVTIYPPANDPFVITVGATEDKGTASLADDNLAVFSAYGPRKAALQSLIWSLPDATLSPRWPLKPQRYTKLIPSTASVITTSACPALPCLLRW